MDCRVIQELILTDFMDKELSADHAAQVKAHIDHCARCKALWEQASSVSPIAFEKTERAKVPESVWQNIREQIREPESASDAFLSGKRWWDELGRIFTPLRLAEMVPVLAMIIFAVVFLQKQESKWEAVARQTQEQVVNETVVFLVSLEDPLDEIEELDFGSPLEAIFL